jgi:YHS domain-containing protein
MKKILTFILVLFIGFTFSSCMMMMPGHMSGSMNENHSQEHAGMKVDPVCGKYVDERSAFTYEYKGNKYYFETEQCMSVYKNDPEHFKQKQDYDKRRKSWATAGMVGGAVAMTAMMVLMMVAVF